MYQQKNPKQNKTGNTGNTRQITTSSVHFISSLFFPLFYPLSSFSLILFFVPFLLFFLFIFPSFHFLSSTSFSPLLLFSFCSLWPSYFAPLRFLQVGGGMGGVEGSPCLTDYATANNLNQIVKI